MDYVDRSGRPFDHIFDYLDYMADPANFMVQRSAFFDAETGHGYTVSTIFEGIAMRYSRGCYETMVLCSDPSFDECTRRWPTEADAFAGHVLVCRLVVESLLRPVAVYRQLPWLPAPEETVDA